MIEEEAMQIMGTALDRIRHHFIGLPFTWENVSTIKTEVEREVADFKRVGLLPDKDYVVLVTANPDDGTVIVLVEESNNGQG